MRTDRTALASGNPLEDLREILELRYRAAYPELTEGEIFQSVAYAFQKARNEHSDFDLLGSTMRTLVTCVFADYTVAYPSEYVEMLYVIARHADFAEAGRAQGAAIQAQQFNPGISRIQ